MKNTTLVIFAIALCVGACSKKNETTVPQLAGVRVTAAGVNTAMVINKVISNGGTIPTVVGTCWSATNPKPTLDNSNGHTINQAGSDGQYTDSLKGLSYNTKYYLRAYATNAAGTGYSVVDSFVTLQTPYPPGQAAMGGVVLMIDSTGVHGLVVAGPEYVVYRPWSNSHDLLSGTSTNFGSGPNNTLAIIGGINNDPGTAAAYCNNLVVSGYDDWFLPSYEELLYFRNNMTFGQWLNYVMDMYWSSSEAGSNEAFFVVIGGGASFNTYDKLIGKVVLPMRRF
jgi:hypothetical protein